MAVNVTKMSKKELEKLKVDVEKALANLAKEEKKEARKAAEKAAAKFGFSLSELTGNTKAKGKAKAAAPAKYADPNDASQTWTGRGRQPQWFKDAIAAGTSPETMEI